MKSVYYQIMGVVLFSLNGVYIHAACSPLFFEWKEDAVYAPWRDMYKKEEKQQTGPTHHQTETCVFCAAPHGPEHNFVLARYEHCYVIMNIYPYTKGHILVIPYQHTARLSDLLPEARLEIMNAIAKAIDSIQGLLQCAGFNIGVNMGKAAKASVPDHLHFHIMPRYEVDSGFAQLIGGTKVVAWDLEELYQQMLPLF